MEGGSTITQQLAKTLFDTRQNVFKKNERSHNRDQLGAGLQQRQAFGNVFEPALFRARRLWNPGGCKLLFSKDVKDLTVSEGAVLASIPKAPSTYSPILNPEKAVSGAMSFSA